MSTQQDVDARMAELEQMVNVQNQIIQELLKIVKIEANKVTSLKSELNRPVVYSGGVVFERKLCEATTPPL